MLMATSNQNNMCVLLESINSCKKDFLFRGLSTHTRNNIVLDEEALYSTTDLVTADKIAQDILKFVPATATVTDATACIGGSTYGLCSTFAKVNAIELDPKRFIHLKHNLLVMKCNMNKLNCINGDAIIECQKLQQDVIFIDPPWGGPEYKNSEHLSLFLSDMPLSTVCKTIAPFTKYIALKVPTNFELLGFLQETQDVMKLVHINISLRKIHLLILKVT